MIDNNVAIFIYIIETQCFECCVSDELSRYFDCGVSAPKEAVENTKMMMKQYQDKIKSIHMKYQWENDKSIVIDKQWLMVGALINLVMPGGPDAAKFLS